MEPLTIIAISGAVGGAAGKLIEKAWDSGEKWLETYFMDHHPRAQEKAKKNILEFLNDLAQRVHQLEDEVREDNKMKKRIGTALEDPDFAALLKQALIASSRTDNKEKHKVLGRIVSERLRCQSEGLLALTSPLACNAVKYLTNKQMRILGIITFVHGIRATPFPPAIPVQQFGQWYVEWLTKMLSFYLPIELPVLRDFYHLESVSCIVYEPLILRELKIVLTYPADAEYDWPFDDFIKNNPLGKQLNQLWDHGIHQVKMTTVGQLIGIYVHDELTKTKTTINW